MHRSIRTKHPYPSHSRMPPNLELLNCCCCCCCCPRLMSLAKSQIAVHELFMFMQMSPTAPLSDGASPVLVRLFWRHSLVPCPLYYYYSGMKTQLLAPLEESKTSYLLINIQKLSKAGCLTLQIAHKS